MCHRNLCLGVPYYCNAIFFAFAWFLADLNACVCMASASVDSSIVLLHLSSLA